MNSKQKAEIFFQERFPDKKKDKYFNKWVERFETGHPETFMDEISREVYFGLIKEKKI